MSAGENRNDFCTIVFIDHGYLIDMPFRMTPLKIFLATLFLSLSFPLLAQEPVTEQRVELSFRDTYGGYKVRLFGGKGLLLMARDNDYNGAGERWKAWHYDSNLREQKSVEFASSNRMFFSSLAGQEGVALATFFNSRKGLYEFHLIDVPDMRHRKLEGMLPKKTYVRQIGYLRDKIYMTCSQKRNHFLYVIDAHSGDRKVYPIMDREGNLEGLQVDTLSNLSFVFANDFEGYREHALVARIFDGDQFADEFNLSDGHDQVISSASGSRLDDGAYFFSGTYSRKKANVSEGLYIAKGKEGQLDWVRFYNFTKFENFFKYLSLRRQVKVEKKIARKEEKGKQANFRYLMATHNVRMIGGRYYLIGEAYYPTYRQESFTDFVNGNPVTRTRTVFDGYQYTHAFLACFDLAGELIWDQVFEMWPSYKPFRVIKFVQPSFQDGYIDLLFSSYKLIQYKSVTENGEVVQEKDFEMIDTGLEGDKLRRSISTMNYWYGNHFLAFGYQKIKNKDGKAEKKRRKVYFLNKIGFGE